MDELLGEPYIDPVMAEDGFVYERTFIEDWFQHGGNKSPKTLLPIGTALFYPFEYYQARAVWAKAKGLPETKKPEQYGLIRGTRPATRSAAPETWSVNYNYYDEDEDEEEYLIQEEYPPLPRPSPPSRPPVVRPARR